MTRTTALLTAAIATTLVAPLVLSTDADAKRRGKHFYSETFETRERIEGYEGFAGIGLNKSYCSFYRVPKRSCTYFNNGRRRCKVTGWILHQQCH